jgi:hypothetical protein
MKRIVLLFIGLANMLCLAAQVQEADSVPKIKALIADSLALSADSIPQKTDAIDAPVQYAAKDSMIMALDGHNMVYLFGEASVQYKDLNLTGERIEVDADSSRVYATFALDSVGEEFGYPIFKQGSKQYEM